MSPDYREPYGPEWAPTGNTAAARKKVREEFTVAAWLVDEPSRIDWDYEVDQ